MYMIPRHGFLFSRVSMYMMRWSRCVRRYCVWAARLHWQEFTLLAVVLEYWC